MAASHGLGDHRQPHPYRPTQTQSIVILHAILSSESLGGQQTEGRTTLIPTEGIEVIPAGDHTSLRHEGAAGLEACPERSRRLVLQQIE